MKKKQNQQKGKKKTTIKQMERSRKGKCRGGKKYKNWKAKQRNTKKEQRHRMQHDGKTKGSKKVKNKELPSQIFQRTEEINK